MTESGLWAYIKKGMLTSGWHVTRIESSAGNGVPDVSFGIPEKNGFIELKYIKEWPKRESTKVKLPLRPEQKHWLKARGQLSGNVWVICRIEDYFYLLDYDSAIIACDVGWTQDEWKKHSNQYWWKSIDFKGLYIALKGGR